MRHRYGDMDATRRAAAALSLPALPSRRSRRKAADRPRKQRAPFVSRHPAPAVRMLWRLVSALRWAADGSFTSSESGAGYRAEDRDKYLSLAARVEAIALEERTA